MLSADHADTEQRHLEKRALTDELFERYAQDVAKSPADHGMDYVHWIGVVEKVK